MEKDEVIDALYFAACGSEARGTNRRMMLEQAERDKADERAYRLFLHKVRVFLGELSDGNTIQELLEALDEIAA